ncbi:MAG TPA: class I SAM-dependent methyltransferase [Acidimicrobiales bacterium]|nr:class I SAM-dependent methyltransferase [Acidimicrobiales bacterium]
MARVDYSGRMASVYGAGRRLAPEAMSAWMDAASSRVGAADGPILDLGSGTGRFSSALGARFGVMVVAVEPAEGMRHQAVTDDVGRAVAMVAGRAESVPVRDGAFVAVWASQVVHHVDDLPACAAELRRVVRPGGPVLLRGTFEATCPLIPWAPYFPEAIRIATERFPTLEEITAAFDAAGLHRRAHDIIWQTTAGSMGELAERVRLRADSTLELLTIDEFAAGLARLEAAAAAETSPVPVREAIELVAFASAA